MYKIAIVDDKLLDINMMQECLTDYCSRHSIKYKIDIYNQATDFHFNRIYDAIFLDIEMPGKNGLTLAQEINEKFKTYIIFMTSFKEYMHLTFEAKPFHFIHKEYIRDESEYILNLLFKKLNKKELYIKDKVTSVSLLDIYYIKIEDHMCIIHTKNKEYTIWESLSSLYNQLDQSLFYQINQSTLINISYVKEVKDNQVILKDNHQFSLSRKYKKQFINNYEYYLVEKL